MIQWQGRKIGNECGKKEPSQRLMISFKIPYLVNTLKSSQHKTQNKYIFLHPGGIPDGHNISFLRYLRRGKNHHSMLEVVPTEKHSPPLEVALSDQDMRWFVY